MGRQTQIFLIALLGSILLHLMGLAAYVNIAKVVDYERRSDLRRKAATQPTSRPATRPADEPEIVFYPDMGDDNGNGIGSNSASGNDSQLGPKAPEDQALLTRSLPGMRWQPMRPPQAPGPDGDGAPPAISAIAPPVESVAAAKAQEESQAVQPPVRLPPIAAALPLPQVDIAPIESQIKPKVEDTPTPPTPQVTVVQKTQKPVDTTPTVQKVQQPQIATQKPGVQEPIGEPRQKSDSDSDIFSRISDSFVFHAGKLVARQGRKVKTTTPQVGIAGFKDAEQLDNATVVLEVHIAASGKVTDVKIAHSSGSNNLDEPTRLAIYDWWFEPARDKKGRPVPDVCYFSVEFI